MRMSRLLTEVRQSNKENIVEGGHTDVASAKNNVKVAMAALEKMTTELSKLNDEDALPSWWTNKVAIAVDKLDGMADYLDTQVENKDEIEETKSSTGYELFHNTLGSAIDTAVSHAKTKFGITISDEERMDKVGMGPRKPSKGKTNSYRLMGTDKSGKSKGIQVQVYNMGNKFELNMYKESIDEEVELDERMKYTHVAVDKEGMVIGFASDEKDAKDMARRNDGKVVKLKKPMSDKKGDMMINRPFKEEVEIDEMFDYAIIDGDNKIIGLYKGKDAKKHAQLNLKGAEKQLSVKKPVKIAPVSKKKVGDTVIGIGEEVEIDEKFRSRRPSSKEVKMAIGIANDPRYAGGNMTGAVKAIEKIRDGLSDYPEVAAALRKANENTVHEASMKIGNIDFELFDNMKGSKAANMAMNKEIGRASQMKDYKTARTYMDKVQRKYSKFGAEDSEPERTIDAVLKKSFKESIDESVKFAGMPAGLSKARIKADRDVYAQVLGIKEAIDPADFDISATSKDIENARKNIILQLRKAVNIGANAKPVQFAHSKEKVNPNIANAALEINQKLKSADEKEAFQRKIARSYKDLLKAVQKKGK